MRRKKKLQIANCKLQIVNWQAGNQEQLGECSKSAASPGPSWIVATLHWRIFPICNLQFAICNLQLFFFLLVGSLAFAAAPPSTDDQLRDSLNSKTDDDYDRALLGDPVKPDDKGKVDDAMQKKLQKELGSAAQKEDEPANPLLHVAEEMRGVQQQLDHRDSGRPTQDVQARIVADLAKLIDDAKKSGSCSGGASPEWPQADNE